ncbi:hypothetical protein LTR53_002683 [Teratosphaeriaceae sp. CCFEE 6253]|nr:hypothetical protein LTR53_002683 [Teratosphaeriaceae sp. CCFEE 6253]
MKPRILPALLAALPLLLPIAAAKNASEEQWITYSSDSGQPVYLRDDRKPALYTGNFGDCRGDSTINVTRFDAAYYKDNMTVLFHLAGNTGLANESLMMYIGVYAYGQSRFDLTFNPCGANIASLCPANSSVPIEASGIIPIAQSDIDSFPAIALAIPDFEGEAILRIFANRTESEIGCYSAVVTNGATFAQPKTVGSVLGIFTAVAVLASFATAAYGEAVPTMRLHYAHSLSVGVIFAVFQHIFLTGALSVNWPSVLVAWWSNFAWAGGMIHSTTMQNSINRLIGNNVGNTSQVGAAAAGTNQDSLGGGYDISQIYKRGVSGAVGSTHPRLRDIASEIYRQPKELFGRDVVQRSVEHTLQRRELANATSGYKWYGHPVGAGLPLPGNYSGFAGTLAQEGIRASNAFMTGFLWFLILLVLLVSALVAFKWLLEACARIKLLKEGRFTYFRQQWLGYAGALALRIFYLAFGMMMFLTIFQFTYSSSAGVKAVAGLVFVVFLIGVPGLAVAAVLYKKSMDKREKARGGLQVERKKLLGKIPWFGISKKSAPEDSEQTTELQQHPSDDTTKLSGTSSKAFWRRASVTGSFTDDRGHRHSIHDSESYTARFGFLAARFRRTRWWFFAPWLLYEFVRAALYAGASGYPLAQVFGLLVVEVLAFVFTIWARPFEGRRLNMLVVYALGFSKVASVALSAAFDLRFNLDRIVTTVIGIVIIVIQGVLTILTLVAIIVGAVSSYMSVSRNREDFRPRKLAGVREKYFNHLDKAVNDLPEETKAAVAVVERDGDEGGMKAPYFEMKSVRRLAKIEDEDADFTSEIQAAGPDPGTSYLSLGEDRTLTTPGRAESVRNPRSGTATPTGGRRARASSALSATNLPYGARPHRPSWSARDLGESEQQARTLTSIDMTRSVPDEPLLSPAPAAVVVGAKGKGKHAQKPSRSATLPTPSTAVRPQTSADELRVGGDTSSRDTIGRVPAPAVRPRAGTYGSLGRRSQTPSYADLGAEASGSREWLGELSYATAGAGGGASRGGDRRASRRGPLTPAQEQDEFIRLSPRLSREH